MSVVVPDFFAHFAPDVEAGKQHGADQKNHNHPAAAALVVALHLAPFGVELGVDLIRQRCEHFGLVHHLCAGVRDGAVFQLVVQQLPHRVDGRGIADIIAVGITDRSLAHIVDEHLGRFLVFACGWDAHVVHEEVDALRGVDEREPPSGGGLRPALRGGGGHRESAGRGPGAWSGHRLHAGAIQRQGRVHPSL